MTDLDYQQILATAKRFILKFQESIAASSVNKKRSFILLRLDEKIGNYNFVKVINNDNFKIALKFENVISKCMLYVKL